LTVKPRHEKAASLNLRMRGVDEFVPLYRARHSWSDRIKTVELPLFPGYAFCRMDPSRRLTVLNTPGIASIIGFGGQDATIPDEEIRAVRRIVDAGTPAQPWPYLCVGQRVVVRRGALEGLEGILVREKGPLRIVVTVELLQRSVAAEIDRDAVDPVGALVRRPVGGTVGTSFPAVAPVR
jgi:transcription antitermination factor NusG